MLSQTLLVITCLSVVGGYIAHNAIITAIPKFMAKNLFGRDQCKKEKTQTPEPMGVVAAAVYLFVLFLMIPFLFYEWSGGGEGQFNPITQLATVVAAVASITAAIFLGFVDDILDVKWREKLVFSSVSSLPMLIVYNLSGHSTTVLLPKFVIPYIGTQALDIGPIFYLYMGMLIVFCTNSINILAGINGVEAGQGLIISMTVAVYNLIQLWREETLEADNVLSLAIIVPFIAINGVLWKFNKYPAKVFVGDTFCYWSGMTIAVVGILGHFPKTLLLFFIPQIFNFLMSIPQLFKFVPCPRHRLPNYNPQTDLLSMSKFTFTSKQTKFPAKYILSIFSSFGLIQLSTTIKDDEIQYESSNFTILNLYLKMFGPMHESSLANLISLTQVLCSMGALALRFYFAGFVYEYVH
uniref:UDP-N-acetylglucosamine--dolichyl-phosphate N-acetylglucosaminephosphotransferase n=1 Tax=Rhabditophanes sp. KR3021 TaxID=114890 RepID=A0AC35TX07_9BILA